jgi:gamma-glutamylcyclotransferase (GGCT)/AIG2-like uncharacterized protein YtfP
MEIKKIFVYGTLLKGEHNHYLLENAEFLFYGKTKKEYTLYGLGSFPGMVEGGRYSISGEVYAVKPSELQHLDALEEHPDWYVRKEIVLENGEKVETYILPLKIAVESGGIKINGDWKKNKPDKSFEETLLEIENLKNIIQKKD